MNTEEGPGGETERIEMQMEGTRLEKNNDWRAIWRARFQYSKGMLLVLASEFFGTCMGAAARLLENGEGGGMETLQVCDKSFLSRPRIL